MANTEALKDLNRVKKIVTERPNGTLRIQQSFENCPSKTEQHGWKDSDINYLMERYKPDELAMYIAARNSHRHEIIGHDFSKEPSLQEARGVIGLMKKAFDSLPEEIKKNFKDHLEFVKFIDNPDNREKMIKMGIMQEQEIKKLAGEVEASETELAPELTTQEEGKKPSKKK